MARFKVETILALEQYLPDAASAANPVDVLGDARADRYRFAMENTINDPNVDGMMVLLTPQAMTEIEDTALAIGEIGRPDGEAHPGVLHGRGAVTQGIELLNKHNVPNYPFPERAACALKAMSDYREIKRRPEPRYARYEVDRKAVEELFERVLSEGRVTIGDAEARQLMQAYGFRIPASAGGGDTGAGGRDGGTNRLPGGAEDRLARYPAQDGRGWRKGRTGRR